MCAETTRTHLFVLRLWREPSQPSPDWRGSVTHTDSGETRYFRDAESLYATLARILGNVTADEPPPA